MVYMNVKYKKHMKKLWSLAGEIGTLAESDKRYETVYMKLADALDAAESTGLITHTEEEENATQE